MHQNLIDDRGGNIAYSRAALRQAQIIGHYNQIQTQNNVQFTVDGVYGTLAPTDNQAFSTGHPTITGCNLVFYGIWVNNTNVIATTAGQIVDPATLGNGGTNVRTTVYPPVVANNVLIGLLKVKVGVGASFVPGTTNLNATNVTATFFDTSVMPTIPQLF
jgi:hypothetical protein